MNRKDKPPGLIKSPTGIAGLDEMTGGGLPVERTTLVLGGPGSGKTVFGLQTLVGAAHQGEPGVFVSFSERPRQIVENGASFGWDLEELGKCKITLLDAQMRPSIVRAGHFDMTGMLAGVRAVATEMGARRIVFDAVDVLLTLLDDRLSEAQEVFRLRDWLLENQFTALIAANLEPQEPHSAQRRALLQSIADCSVSLDCRVNHGIAERRLRVTKYRGSGCVEHEVPFVIGGAGIELLLPSPATSALEPELVRTRTELGARLQAAGRIEEIKQAELAFLRGKEARAGEKRPGRSRAAPRPA